MPGATHPIHNVVSDNRSWPANKWIKANGSLVPVGFRAIENQRIARVQSLFTASMVGLSILRTGSDYSLFYPAGGGRFIQHTLATITGNGADGPYGAGGVTMLRSVNEVCPSGATIPYTSGTTSGGGWATSTSGSYTWLRTSTSGDSITITIPAGVEVVNLDIVQHSTGGGVASVMVDGSNASQIYLPKASELAASNRLSSAQLVSNGGSIPDSQRVYSSYLPSGGAVKVSYPLVLSGNGTHTVQISHTGGYRSGASTAGNQRISLYAVRTWKSTDVVVFDPSNSLVSGTLATTSSAWEVATAFSPVGHSSSFMGTYHGNETQTSISVMVDGVTITPVDGVATPVASSVVVTRQGFLSHPTAGRVAAVTTTYTLDSSGLTFSPHIQWETTGEVSAAYAMLPLNGPLASDGFNRAMTSAYTGNAATIPTTTPLDTDFAVARSQSAWVWSSTRIAQLTILNPGQWFEDWNYTDRQAAVEGRALVGTSSVTSLTKVYLSRVKKSAGQGEIVTNGSIHQYAALVRIGWFGDTNTVINTVSGLPL
ncbi:MAG: hypothetical protein WBP22_05640 [Candidatus Saccharimonas sp.]